MLKDDTDHGIAMSGGGEYGGTQHSPLRRTVKEADFVPPLMSIPIYILFAVFLYQSSSLFFIGTFGLGDISVHLTTTTIQ